METEIEITKTGITVGGVFFTDGGILLHLERACQDGHLLMRAGVITPEQYEALNEAIYSVVKTMVV